MPYTWFTFERLGVLDWFEKAGCPHQTLGSVRLDVGEKYPSHSTFSNDQAPKRHDLAGTAE